MAALGRTLRVVVLLGLMAAGMNPLAQAATEDDTAQAYANLEPKTIRSSTVLKDPELRVESGKLGLRRQVEMFQWSRDDGDYVKVWSDVPIPDEGFDAQHQNPPLPSLRNALWLAPDANIDGVPVEPSVLMALGQWIKVRPGFSRVPYRWSRRFEPDGDGLSDSENPLNPQIGDVRLSWSELFVPTLEQKVVLANGVWQLPDNLQLDERTRQTLIAQRAQSESRVSFNDFLMQLWSRSALVLLLGLVALRFYLNYRHKKSGSHKGRRY